MTKQEFLAMSLPFKLICQVTDRGFTKLAALGAVYIDGQVSFFDTVESEHGFESFKPILRPLSDLTKEIEHKGDKFVPLHKLFQPPVDKKDCDFTNERKSYQLHVHIGEDVLTYDVNKDCDINAFWIVQKLIEWHFDIAGLIEKGEAIDVNSLEINPYK